MSDPGKTVDAQIRYEVRIQPGPWKFKFRGEEVKVEDRRDLAVIVRLTLLDGTIMDEKIVAIVGDEYYTGSFEFLRLRKFLAGGGVIGLHRDLDF